MVFKIHEVNLSRPNLSLEVVMDDHMFPTYVSQKIRTKQAKVEDSKFYWGLQDCVRANGR